VRAALRVVLTLWLSCAAIATRAQDDDLDDILGGFDDDDPVFEIEEADTTATTRARWWDFSGSVETSGSVAFRDHHSDTGTDYGGLQRLRTRLNGALDVDVPEAWLAGDWKLRLEGWGFWDAAYAIQGRSRYTRAVLGAYELDGEVGEAWAQGAVHDAVDLKLGRQIVVWGRSESLRVLDVLNPLDNREPGRIDLEDLRRPLAMARADAYAGAWTLSAIAVPEIRFDRNPVRGSDFFAGTAAVREAKPHDFSDSEYAGALTGVFPGWDVSLHGAWFWNDLPRLSRSAPLLVHDRLWLAGVGGNLTIGGWLLKFELAGLGGLGFSNSSEEKQRVDVLAGVEYYGFRDTTVVFEVVNRHLFDYEAALGAPPDFARENAAELALRITRSLLHETLHLTVLAIALDWDAGGGSVVRLDADYELRDALSVGVGVLLYQKGDAPPLDGWERNDRLIFDVKWSF